MNPALIVILSKSVQILFVVMFAPEEHMFQILVTDRYSTRLSINEWVRGWRVRNALDFLDLEDFYISLPLVVAEQGIIVGTRVFWCAFERYRLFTQTTVDITDVLSIELERSFAGIIMSKKAAGKIARYVYSQGRLTGANTAGGQYRYQYDAVGNRISRLEQHSDGTQID